MRPFDPAAMTDDFETPVPHGGGIVLATTVMFVGWLAMFLLT